MKATIFSTLLFALLFSQILAVQASAFRWVDENGKVHIGVKPVEKPAPKPISMPKPENVKNKATLKKSQRAPIAVEKSPINRMEQSKPSSRSSATSPKAKPPKTMSPRTMLPRTAPPTTATSKKSVQIPATNKPVIASPVRKAVTKKKAVAKKKPVVKEKPVTNKKPVAKKKQKPKTKPVKSTNKNKVVVPSTTAEKSDKARNKEMCGVFTDYVRDYKQKVNTCSGSLCDIYKRSLSRYKKKQKSYCNK